MIKRNNLREMRQSKGLSGYDLQILSHIPAEVIYRIERGIKRPLPYERTLIAQALDADVDEVFPPEIRNSDQIVDTINGARLVQG